jgi:two-component system OmpR family response regulator
MREKPLILVVDDDENFLEIFGTKLAAAGFDVAAAKDGKEAVKKAGEAVPDLILMDIHMPHDMGTDIALEIKQNPALANLKVAFLTALKEPWPAVAGEKEKIARELGMEDFIEKGEDLDVIVARVQEILARGMPPAPDAEPSTAEIPPETVPPGEAPPGEAPGGGTSNAQ